MYEKCIKSVAWFVTNRKELTEMMFIPSSEFCAKVIKAHKLTLMKLLFLITVIKYQHMILSNM